jgi:hypothetical protein
VGRHLTSALSDEVLRRGEMAKLVELLPTSALLGACGLNEASAPRENHHMAQFSGRLTELDTFAFLMLWLSSHSTLSDEVMRRWAMAQLTRLLEFLLSHNIPWDGTFGRFTELHAFASLMRMHKPLLMNISILPLCRALSTLRSIQAPVVTLQVLCSTTPTRGPPAFRGDWRSPLRGSPSYAHRTITHSALSDEVMCRLAMAPLTRLLEFLVSHNISWDRLTELNAFASLMQVHNNALAKGSEARPGFCTFWFRFRAYACFSKLCVSPTECSHCRVYLHCLTVKPCKY